MKQFWKKAAACMLSAALLAGGTPVYMREIANNAITAEALHEQVKQTFLFEIHRSYGVTPGTTENPMDKAQTFVDDDEEIQLISTHGDENGVNIGSGAFLQIKSLTGKKITKVEMTCSYYQPSDYGVTTEDGLDFYASATGDKRATVETTNGTFGKGSKLTISDLNCTETEIRTWCPDNISWSYVPGDLNLSEITVYYETGQTLPAFSEASLSLADDLVLNFYGDEDVTAANYQDYTVKFEGGCRETEGKFLYNEKTGKYYVPVHICAKDVRQEIKATICKDGKAITNGTYSAERYLSKLINGLAKKYREETITADERKTLALACATMAFGYYSDLYFGVSKDLTVDTAKEFFNFSVVTMNMKSFSLSEYSFSDPDTKLSLVLDSKTALRLYVKGHESGGKAFASNIESTKAEYPSYYQITGILPQELSKVQTITDKNGTEYKVAALSWAYRVAAAKQQGEDVTDKDYNMALALLAYNQAAKNYLGQNA